MISQQPVTIISSSSTTGSSCSSSPMPGIIKPIPSIIPGIVMASSAAKKDEKRPSNEVGSFFVYIRFIVSRFFCYSQIKRLIGPVCM